MIKTCEEGAARAGACWLGSSIIFLESGAKSEKYPRFKPINTAIQASANQNADRRQQERLPTYYFTSELFVGTNVP